MAEANYSRAGTRREWAWESVSCLRCGKAFEAKRRDARKYCSRVCQNDHSDAFVERRCFNCLSTFRFQASKANRGHSKGTFCSRECSFQDFALYGHPSAGKCNHWAMYAGQCDRAAKREADKRAKLAMLPASRPIAVCARAYCGAAFERKARTQQYCSALCRDECAAERRAERAKQKRPMTEAAKATRRAAKKKYKTLRRARKAIRAENIDPIKVFDRDGWRCHLCGCKTPRRLRGTNEPRAPELDHVVSLADGGWHTWGNVACACRACNGAKGARSAGQLGLGLAA